MATRQSAPTASNVSPLSPSDSGLTFGVLVGYGGLQLVQGAFMVVAPGAFYDLIGPFGPRNDHYIRDAATWSLALGVLCLLAARRPGWRAPVLLLASAQLVLHTVNHVVDVGLADPAFVGVVDAVTLGAMAVVLVVLARRELST
jgi:hypothetical protein